MQELKKNNNFRVNYKKNKMKKKYTKKNWLNFIYLKHLKRKLKKIIKNMEIFKIPKFIGYYLYLKKWRKPRLKLVKYRSRKLRKLRKSKFFFFKYKYFNKYRAKISEWKNFKYFKREFYFWFKRRTKRQLYILKKQYLLNKKGNKIKNYFKLKKKYFSKKKYLEYLKVKYLKLSNKFRFRFFYYYYLKVIFNKKSHILKKFLFSKKNYFKIYKFFYSFNFLFKKLRFYLRRFFRKKFAYIDFIDSKELKYIRSKWVQRIKKRRKFIYKQPKFEKKAKFFFRLKRKIFFILSLPELKNQFYYLKVKTVDTNFYITLTNFKHEVIIYRSTGQVSENRKKKIKLSPFTINNMIFDIIKKIKSLKLKYIVVHINSKINKNIKTVFRTIGSSVNTKLVKAEFTKPIPHHFGTRKAKPRRL